MRKCSKPKDFILQAKPHIHLQFLDFHPVSLPPKNLTEVLSCSLNIQYLAFFINWESLTVLTLDWQPKIQHETCSYVIRMSVTWQTICRLQFHSYSTHQAYWLAEFGCKSWNFKSSHFRYWIQLSISFITSLRELYLALQTGFTAVQAILQFVIYCDSPQLVGSFMN